MLFVAVQKEIHKAISDAGFGVQVKYCADAPFGHDLDEDEVCELLEPTYMDDLAIPMMADTPAGIMEAVQCAAEAMGLAASKYGLTVNFAAGKTEALMTMVGKERQAARDDLAKLVEEREDGKCARIPLRDGSGEKVRVVQFYKHLGSKTSAQPIMGPEIAGRCSAGKVASAAWQILWEE